MIITIEEQTFDTKNITQLYPAAIIKTGYKDETTQVSLEWLELESKGRVELESYGIFIHMDSEEKHSFFYENKEALDQAIGKLAAQLNNKI